LFQINHHESMSFYGNSFSNIRIFNFLPSYINYNFASGSFFFFLVTIFYIFAMFVFYTVEDLLLHDLYVLIALAEQESSSERLK
jgi:hypothetical protein